MINSNKGISTPIVLTIIIVLAVILVGGVSVYQYYYLPKQEAEISKVETPKDETSDWKTLKTDYFGFEIKYPSEWFTNVNIQNISTVKPGEWWPVDTLPKGYAKVFFERTGVQSIDDLITEHFSSVTNNLVISDSIVNFNNNAGRSIVYICKNCEEVYIPEIDKYIPGKAGKAVFFSKNNDVVYFWLIYYKDDVKTDYYIDTFNKMLSTLQFLE